MNMPSLKEITFYFKGGIQFDGDKLYDVHIIEGIEQLTRIDLIFWNNVKYTRMSNGSIFVMEEKKQ